MLSKASVHRANSLQVGRMNGSRGWKGKEVRTPSSAQSLLQESGSLKTPQTKQDGKELRAAYLCPGT